MALNLQINAIKPRVQYRADGVRREFLFPFAIFADANLEVYLDSAQVVSGFTVQGAGDGDGGSIVFASPPPAGAIVTLRRRLVMQRMTDFQESGPFRARVLNYELDYLSASVQQLEAEIERAVRLAPADVDARTILPDAANRAGRAIVFDSNGDLTVAPPSDPLQSGQTAWRSLDDIPEGTDVRRFSAAEKTKLASIEDEAQRNAPTVSPNEKALANEPAARSFSPKDVADMVAIHAPVYDHAVTSVYGRTGAVVAQAGDYTADQITETAAKVVMTAAERAKLAGVEAGAGVNALASVHGRTGAVVAQAGDYTAEQIAETVDRVVMTAAERAKLAAVEERAQANPLRVTSAEKSNATSTVVRGFAPIDVRDMVTALAPLPPVTSVAGRTGTIALTKDDVGLSAVTNNAQIRADLLYSVKAAPASGDKLLIKDQSDGQPKVIDWSQLPSGSGPVASVHGRVGAVTGQAGDYTADQITDTAAKVLMTAAERTKLGGVAAGAQVNPTRITAAEKAAGTSATIRGFAPADVRDMVTAFAPSAEVTSVAGRVGAITLSKADVGLDNVSNDAQIRADLVYSPKAAPASGDKLVIKDQADGLPKIIDWNQLPSGSVTAVHGRTGAVVAQAGDYTAAQVGAPTEAEFDALSAIVNGHTGELMELDRRADALEASDGSQDTAIANLGTRLDALEGAGTGKTWIALPYLIRNSQVFTNLPAGPSPWTNTLGQKVSLWHAEKIFFWCHIGTPGAAGNYVRCQYTADLTSNTGWTDIPGADIPLDAISQAGRVSAIVDIPSGAKTQEFVLLRAVGGGGNGATSPVISFFQPTALQNTTSIAGGSSGVASFNGRAGVVVPASGDYNYDQISETATGKQYTATEKTKLTGIESGAQVNTVTSVHGRTGAVVAASGDYNTGQVTEVADKKFVTDAEKAKLANVPSDTNASLAGKADGAATTAALATKADAAATTAALATKAPLASPGLTGSPTAPTPATGDNSTKIATTAFVKAQNYLTSVPPHTHAAADVTGLQTTKAVLAVANADPITLPDHDAVFIEHSGVNANVRIPASWTKKPHTLVFLGNPNACNVAGATGSGQTIKGDTGGGLTFTSGTDVAAVTRTLIPDPDTTGFPNRWRIF